MTNKTSAGLLMYRFKNKDLEVFLAHPGGPFYLHKDNGVWGIPKGLPENDEQLLETAKREFSEETGIRLKPGTNYLDLGSVKYSSGKTVYAWAFADGGYDPTKMASNLTPQGWPENDRGDYFSLKEAATKILPAQKKFLLRLQEQIDTLNPLV